MKYSLRSLFILITVIASLLALWYWREYLPGTFYRDANGYPHGTGIEHAYYRSGQLRNRTWHRAGIPTRQAWYRPDGTAVADNTVDIQGGGDELYLREDGSIKQRI